MQSVTVRKARQQEHEAAGYNASLLQKQKEMNAGAQLTFSFLFQSKTPVHEMELFTVKMGNIVTSIYLI